MPSCGIVILAAGGSTRMGSPKQSLVFEGSTLLTRAVTTALSTTGRPVVVVLGAGAESLHQALSRLPVTIIVNEHWQRGMGTSIRAGMIQMNLAAVDAAMIFLCDQPLITAAAIGRMVDTHFASGKLISAAFYGGSHGTPAIFSKSLFEEMVALEDNQGGKAVIQRHAEQCNSIELPEAEIDVDTKDDFEKLTIHRQ